MRNTLFFVVLAFLLAGCNGKGPTFELKTNVNVTSEKGLPVKIETHDEKPLPVILGAEEEKPLPVKVGGEDEKPLPVKIRAADEKPLPIMMIPDEITSQAVIAFLVVAVVSALATVVTAIAAWRVASNTKKALEEIKTKIGG